MFKVATGLIVVLGLWIGVEIMHEGPTRAFGGLFKDFLPESAVAEAKAKVEAGRLSTAQRAGNAAIRARDEAEARRKRMLGDDF